MADSAVLFTNVRVLDGTGEFPFTGEVLVQGNRIRQVTRAGGGSRFSSGGLLSGGGNGGGPNGGGGHTTIDGMGATLMPGLVEGHLHLSWNNAPTLDAIQLMPPEEHTLWAAEMARVLLDAGFTSGVGAASAKERIDVVIRDTINAGRIPGPRYLAAGQEIATLGGLGDTAPPHIDFPEMSFGVVVSGPEDMRRAVRRMIKNGVDIVKLNLSGEEMTRVAAEESPMAEDEIVMACAEAKRRGKTMAAHARSAESIKLCVRHGIRNIYHASFADEEALDMLEAARDDHFVAPGLAWLIGTARHAGEWGIKPGSPLALRYERELEMAVETMKKMHRRGIRICIGGDYGFAWTPQGTNAKDIETFVDMLGFSPMEALVAATAHGGAMMDRPDELGQIKEGYLADMILVDGDPVASVRVLQEKSRLLAIMKDGKFHKEPRMAEQRRRLIA